MRQLQGIAAIFAIVLSANVQAEVRLDHVGKTTAVAVGMGVSGPWTTAGHGAPTVLNPSGAWRGDGAPTVSVSGTAALACWRDADGGALRLALGDSAWRELPSLGDIRAGLAPQIAPLAGGWLVTWTSQSESRVGVAHISTTGIVAASTPLDVGDVQAIAVTGATFTLISLEPHGQLVATSVLVPDTSPAIFQRQPRAGEAVVGPSPAAGMLPDIPSPVFHHDAPEPASNHLPESSSVIWRACTRTVLAVLPLDQTAVIWRAAATRHLHLPQDAPLVFKAGNSTTLLDPAWQGAATSGTGTVALGGSLVATVQLSPDAALALWWHDAHTLQFVKLTDGEVGEVQQVTGRGEFNPSLVREALRLVAGE